MMSIFSVFFNRATVSSQAQSSRPTADLGVERAMAVLRTNTQNERLGLQSKWDRRALQLDTGNWCVFLEMKTRKLSKSRGNCMKETQVKYRWMLRLVCSKILQILHGLSRGIVYEAWQMI